MEECTENCPRRDHPAHHNAEGLLPLMEAPQGTPWAQDIRVHEGMWNVETGKLAFLSVLPIAHTEVGHEKTSFAREAHVESRERAAKI